ncbi:MAG: acyl-CoA dehydrogenase family protein [Peptococcaceae bacterium]|jgi:butyryl-CoA dehydrogenase|nr:acyl-CoA dehydrogenase family protein [Peptococcaceae bacterium]
MSQFLLTEEQKALMKMCRDFMIKEVIPTSLDDDKAAHFNETAYKKAVEMGLHVLGLPEEYGGAGLDEVTFTLLQEQLHWGDAGFANAMGCAQFAYRPVAMAGTAAQKKKYADIIVPGGFGCFCLTEANAGSDVAAAKTTARKVGDEYIITGNKHFITTNTLGNFYVVFAYTDKSAGPRGMSAILVDAGAPGVTVGKKEDKMGIRQSPTGEIIFEEARAPAGNLLGKEGQGFKIAMETLNYARIDAAASAVGIAQRALELSIQYAKERVIFGKPIYQHQAMEFLIVDMAMRIEAARSLYLRAAGEVDAGNMDLKLCSYAKAFASDVAMKVTTDAVQVFGGFGYTREYPVEKLMRDAKIYQIFEGTNQVQRVVAGKELFK